MGKRELDTRNCIKVITSNNFLKATGLENIGIKARKLLYLSIAQCQKNDNEFFTYSISVKEFAELMGISTQSVYRESDQITDELMHGFLKYIPDGENRFVKFTVFERCEYSMGVLTFKMSPDMTPVLLNLKRDFTQPLLCDFMKMKSNYSVEVWHLMQREMKSKKTGVTDICEFELSLEELRTLTGTTQKFKQISQFKEKVLDQAIKEIKNQCGVVIEYSNIKSGRKIVGFHFSARSLYYISKEEISKETRERVERTKKRFTQRKDY